MPIRGENVGTAYVRILADGRDLDDSIREMFDDTEGTLEGSGRRGSQAYADGFAEEVQKGQIGNRLNEAIRESLIKGDFLTSNFFADKKWTNFRSGLAKEFKDAGRLAGERMEQELLRTGIEGLEPMLDSLNSRIINAQTELNREMRRERERDFENFIESARLREAERIRIEREAQAEADRIQRLGQLMATAQNEDRRRDLLKLRDTYALLNREAGQLLAGHRQDALSKRELLQMVTGIREGMEGLNYENAVWAETLRDQERHLRQVNPRLAEFDRHVTGIADGIGRAFGRGSRNNFVNFIGSMARGMALLPRLFSGVVDGIIKWRNGFLSLSTVAAGFGTTLAGAFVFVGPLLSLLSMLTGVVTALASTAIMGLVGSLGVLAGAFAPVIAGIGVMVAGFRNIPKEARRAVKGIGEEFKALGDVAGESMFSNIDEQAERFRDILGNLRPVVRGIGNAISDVGDRWLDMMEGPGFRAFRRDMSEFLPDAVESLGISLGNALGGFGGLLRGLIPQTERFLGWLEDITEEFSEWANSMRGQNQIQSFMEDAADSAAELGDFLGAVNDLLWTLVDAGNEAGDSLFGSMTSAINGWVEALQADGGAGLREWFDDAVDFGQAIGDVVTGLGRMVDLLDTEASRAIATSIFNSLASALELIVNLLGPVARILDSANTATDGFVVGLGALLLIGPRILGFLGTMTSSLGGFVGDMRNAETRAGRLQGALRGLAGMGGLGLLAAGATQANEGVGLLMGTLGGAGVGFSVGGPWGALIGGAAGAALSKFGGIAEDTGEIVGTGREKLGDYASTFDDVTGAVSRATAELVLHDLVQQGALSTANTFDISRRDLVQATLGEEAAIRRVNSALNSGRTMTAVYTDAMGRTQSMVFDTKKQMDRYTETMREQGYVLDDVKRKQLDSAGADRLRQIIGAISNEWRTASKETRKNILALQDFSDLVGIIPEKKLTKIEATGVVPTVAGVARVAEKFDLLPKQIKPLIEAVGVDTTVADVRAVMARLAEADRTTANPKIHVTSNAAAIAADAARILRSLPDEIVYLRTVQTGPGGQGAGYSGGADGGTVRGSRYPYGDKVLMAVAPGEEIISNRHGQADRNRALLKAINDGHALPGGKTIDASGWTIVTPTEDPFAVAHEVVNTLVASAYAG